MDTGNVRVKGPFTPEEKVTWDRLRARKKECVKEIKILKAMIEDPAHADINKQLKQELKYETELLWKISSVIGP